MNVFLFLAEGFEEIEAITPIDLLRRAGFEVCTVSISENEMVTGAHNISIKADTTFAKADFSNADMLIIPGGMPGTTNLDNHEGLRQLLLDFNSANKHIASICAAPLILGKLGILNGKKATCYPGFEEFLGESHCTERVVISENIITSQGPGTSFDFALAIIEQLMGKEKADEISNGTRHTI